MCINYTNQELFHLLFLQPLNRIRLDILQHIVIYQNLLHLAIEHRPSKENLSSMVEGEPSKIGIIMLSMHLKAPFPPHTTKNNCFHDKKMLSQKLRFCCKNNLVTKICLFWVLLHYMSYGICFATTFNH